MFAKNIHHHSIWRQEIDARLKALSQWLDDRELLSPDIRLQLDRMQQQNRSDKIMVAFVAEFSRGKSELINAIFFAGYGRRIMPASAGRTTMCPTELGYDASDSACLRLLPIQTRLEPQSLLEWRLVPEQWTRVALDVNDPEQLVQAMNKVAETIEVTVPRARALGFWHDNSPDNPVPDHGGMVEVPRWRHARINMDHPLLRQGLVILDTPGLNAIGAEPELTMSLIPQAHAVVFMLATDTGVTASDLAIWREYLAGADDDASRFVVLNKIDTLWDALSTPQQIDKQIEQQRLESARVLDVSQDRVMTVSAQKGLQAKVQGDADLLKRSHLDVFENMLAKRIVESRHEIMLANMASELRDLREQVQRSLNARSAELVEHLAELRGLQGKSDAQMRLRLMRVTQEQEHFESAVSRTQTVRVVHHKALKQVYALLGNNQLLKEVSILNGALNASGFLKLGVKTAYADAFLRLKDLLKQAESKAGEMYELFGGMFKELNAEYGFTLRAEAPPRLDAYALELDAVRARHEQYLGVGNLLKLSQPEFVDRLLRALVSSLRIVFERAVNEIDQWSRKMAGRIDSQLRERRRGLKRWKGSVGRAEAIASDLDENIQKIKGMLDAIKQDRIEFHQQVDGLLEDTSPQQEPPVLMDF